MGVTTVNPPQQESTREERMEAFEDGVREKIGMPHVFVDPEQVRNENSEIYKQNVIDHIKAQLPEEDWDMAEEMADSYIKNPSSEQATPFAQVVNLGEKTYSIVQKPDATADTKAEFIRNHHEWNQEAEEAFIDNTSGSDIEWVNFMGKHEGSHNEIGYKHQDAHAIGDHEAKADSGGLESTDEDLTTEIQDYRFIDAEYDTQLDHSTGPYIISDPALQNMAFDSSALEKQMMDKASEYAKEKFGADNLEDLKKENPDQYFEAVNNGLEQIQQDAVNTYNQSDQGHDSQKAVVKVEIFSNAVNGYEGAYRRRIMGQENVPETKPTYLISEEFTKNIAKELETESTIKSEKIDDLGPEKNRDIISQFDESQLEEMFEGYDWEANGITEGNYQAISVHDPEELIQRQIDYMDQIKNEALENYKSDPSYENRAKLIDAQDTINRQYEFINMRKDAWLNGEERANYEAPQFVDKDLEDQHYKERAARRETGNMNLHSANPNAKTKEETPKQADKNYKQSPDGPLTYKVAAGPSGDVKINEETFKMEVGGTPISQNGGIAGSGQGAFAVAVEAEGAEIVSAKQPEATTTNDLDNENNLQSSGPNNYGLG